MRLQHAIGSERGQANSIRELTLEEMERVAGGNPVGAAVGAVAGAAGYLGNASTTGDFTWSGLAGSTVVGAATGAFGGVSAIARYAVPRISFLGGAAIGRAEDS